MSLNLAFSVPELLFLLTVAIGVLAAWRRKSATVNRWAVGALLCACLSAAVTPADLFSTLIVFATGCLMLWYGAMRIQVAA